MKISVKQFNNQWNVLIKTPDFDETRIYFSNSSMHTAQHVADVLRRDVKKHGEYVINFTDYPIYNPLKKNPAPRIGTDRPRRVSQASGKRPSKRLIERRLKDTKKGYFPNPVKAIEWNEENIYWVQLQAPAGNFVDSIGTHDKKKAFEYARYEAKTYPRQVRVIVKKYAILEE